MVGKSGKSLLFWTRSLLFSSWSGQSLLLLSRSYCFGQKGIVVPMVKPSLVL